jgi:DNA topoisomerase VI subunit A
MSDYRHNLTAPLPLFCLVDNDPYGLNIYGVYKYGGDKSSWIERERLALPDLRYLGIRSMDFRTRDGLIALTERDKRKVDAMLQKEWVQGETEILYVFATQC